MRNLFLTAVLLLTTITINAQITSCSVDFYVTPLNWEEDVFQFGLKMNYHDGHTWVAVKPWDTRPTFHPNDMHEGDVDYVVDVIQNDVIVDQYTITAVKTGEGCLIEFTPDVTVGNKTQLQVLSRL
tara:strand:+ start:57 stop:434 length:378 start_codon:yes stop_codon:yes gene_type:complete